MNRRYALRSLSALAVAVILSGCAYQDPFSLPTLGSPGAGPGPSTSVYYGYGPAGRYGYSPYGYSGYSAYPYYYGSRYPAQPYPPGAYVPYPGGPYCLDADRDGRCDVRTAPPPQGQGSAPDADFFERVRHQLEARQAAGASIPAAAPGALPGRPPPAPQVVPPKASPSPAARSGTSGDGGDANRRHEPANRRSIPLSTDQP